MKTALKKKTTRTKAKSISKVEIGRRLADIDLAQTSAIRDLEMDIRGDAGVDSAKVIAAARNAVA